MMRSMAFRRTHVERILRSFEEIRDVEIAVDHISNDALIESILYNSKWIHCLAKHPQKFVALRTLPRQMWTSLPTNSEEMD